LPELSFVTSEDVCHEAQATSLAKRRMKNDVVVATGCCDLCKAIIRRT
jgi:hypothetical protein